MNLAFAPSKDAEKMRKACLLFLWGVASATELNGPQIMATLDWLKPSKDSGDAWSIDAMAEKELKSVWTAEMKAQGQEPLI